MNELIRNPTAWQRFWLSPTKCLATVLYSLRPRTRSVQSTGDLIKVVCISDIHNVQPPSVPDGDILVHAGDLTDTGTFEELMRAFDWLRDLPHAFKIVVGGNHDKLLDSTDKTQLDFSGITYLQNSSATLKIANKGELHVFGSPSTDTSGKWAFQYSRNEDVWSGQIPLETDVLVTHMPPRFHLDINGFGDDRLLEELWRVKPQVHIFGHVHAGHGVEQMILDDLTRQYHEVRRGRAGFSALLDMTAGLFKTALGYGEVASGRTTLVNAAMANGTNNNEKRREAIVVHV